MNISRYRVLIPILLNFLNNIGRHFVKMHYTILRNGNNLRYRQMVMGEKINKIIGRNLDKIIQYNIG
ncbi:hypothetical protein [Candidatus Methylobacter oryzae]|uniref:hypothetical protein n=1 Tax=Candidatus Methylobacter oryzae TaxID=2497749 RepID=UPI001F502938|nr:hypothetical protein [Candidatus Methylobacter oryzae]